MEKKEDLSKKTLDTQPPPMVNGESVGRALRDFLIERRRAAIIEVQAVERFLEVLKDSAAAVSQESKKSLTILK